MKVSVMDSKLRKHVVDVDSSASVADFKQLLANMLLVPAGFEPKIVYQKRTLSDSISLGSIGLSSDDIVSLVCVRTSPVSTAAIQEPRSAPNATLRFRYDLPRNLY